MMRRMTNDQFAMNNSQAIRQDDQPAAGLFSVLEMAVSMSLALYTDAVVTSIETSRAPSSIMRARGLASSIGRIGDDRDAVQMRANRSEKLQPLSTDGELKVG